MRDIKDNKKNYEYKSCIIQMIMPESSTMISYKNILAQTILLKARVNICYPPQTPHKVSLFFSNFKSFREKKKRYREKKNIEVLEYRGTKAENQSRQKTICRGSKEEKQK